MAPSSTASNESDDAVIAVPQLQVEVALVSNSHSSGEPSPIPEDELSSNIKKKKKRKPKKSAKAKDTVAANAATTKVKTPEVNNNDPNSRPPVLCISRNKHWRYISSYHVWFILRTSPIFSIVLQGPWLQLPLELLESLLVLNLDPATLSVTETRLSPISSLPVSNTYAKTRDRGFLDTKDFSPPDTPRDTFTSPTTPTFPTPKTGKATPPPIDPGVFRCVTSIRRLIDEAAELSVRATSGLSVSALRTMRGGSSLGINNRPWATAQVMGLNPLGDGGGGRNVAMSAMRVHRLRALAVQKLAQAYKADEIASSVMVMQGGSVFEDIAERVLKVGVSILCLF